MEEAKKVETKSQAAEAPTSIHTKSEVKKDNTARNVAIALGGCLILLICLLICVFIVLPLIGVSIIGAGATQVANEIEKTQQINQNAYNAPKSLNETVRVGDVEWKVEEVKNFGDTVPAANQFFDEITKPDTKFIMLKFSAKNLGTSSKTLLGLKIVDAEGKQYDMDSMAALNVRKPGEESSAIASINPNIVETFVDVFEVAEDATGLRLEITDLSILSPKKEYIDLGL